MQEKTFTFDRDYTEGYTALKKFYAWCGFVALVVVVAVGVWSISHWVIWANEYVNASLH